GHPLGRIIDDHRELISGGARRLPDDKIAADVLKVHAGWTPKTVLESGRGNGCLSRSSGPQAEAPGVWPAQGGGLGRAAPGAGARINRSLVFGVRGTRGAFDVEPATGTRVDQLAALQLFQGGFIVGQALRLNNRAFVPVQAEPAQVCTR